ncbi:hypothetical protein TWF506_002764 [Arthrobotrys conoides]|uniref:Uncharacterized protein n=1 Tax=Arthrobotrys conoides TaxID=74498 RepID=A0AAN8NBR5_9PEZI
MRDDDTASIWSSAPSYRSTIDPPPYSADGALPSYSSSSSLLGTSSGRASSGSSGSSAVSRGLPPIPPSRSGLPPVAFITPGSRGQQSRQYQAVAARRQAKLASKSLYNPNFSSRIFPRDNPIRQNAPGLTYDTYNSLHPVLSARNSPHALSTAELFLCTCGRHNSSNSDDPENAIHVIDPRAPRPLHNPIFDEPCPVTLRPPATKQEPLATAGEKEDPHEGAKKTSRAGGPSDRASRDEDAEEPKDEEDLDTESKSWDFMISQM